MAQATNIIVINRPIKEVFDYVSNGANDIYWRKDMLLAKQQTKNAGLGAIYKRVIHGPFGTWQRIRQDYKITAYDAPQTLSYKHTKGLARPLGRFELSKVSENDTRITFTLTWQPKSPVGRMIDTMLEEQFKADVAGLEKLKQLLEK